MSANRMWRTHFCRLLTLCREGNVSQCGNVSRKFVQDTHCRQLRYLRTSTQLYKDPDNINPDAAARSPTEKQATSIAEPKKETLSVTKAKKENVSVTDPKVENVSVTEAKTEHVSVAEPRVEKVSVTKAKIEDVSVTQPKVEHVSVTEAKTEDISIIVAKEEQLSVTDPKVEHVSVTEPKVEHVTVAKVKKESVTYKTETLSVAEPKQKPLHTTKAAEDKLSASFPNTEKSIQTDSKEGNLDTDVNVTSAVDGSSTDDTSSSSDDSSSSDSDSDFDEELVLDATVTEAASKAAAALPGDKRATIRDLLSKLNSQVKLTIDQQQGKPPKKPALDYSELFKAVQSQRAPEEDTGTEVVQRQPAVFINNIAPDTTQRRLGILFAKFGVSRIFIPQKPGRPRAAFAIMSFPTEDAAQKAIDAYNGTLIDGSEVRLKIHESQFQQRAGAIEDPQNFKNSGIFDGTPVGIFSKSDVSKNALTAVEKPGLHEVVNAEEADTTCLYPPRHGFEEMIQWTAEGKLWNFPIDNEQGWEEEQKVGFHEHVFLDHLLEEFPERGPVRHFMELVTTALSQNPHLTVRQKHEHIRWYRDYFTDKHAVLKENLGEDGLMPPARISQSSSVTP